MKLYCIYDKKSKSFNDSLQTFKHDYDAIRAVKSVVDNKDAVLSKFADDFDFFCLCDIDLLTGTITEEKRVVCSLAQLRDSE